MTMLLYSLALTLGLTLASPWWLTRMMTTQRYREGLRQRLGFVPAALRTAASGKRVIWLHAVSVGEVLAASRLVAELEEALGSQHPQHAWRVVISTTTRTGQTLARQRFGADRVFYMPLDFAFAVRAYLRALQPATLILMESELWPRLLHECAARSIPVVVANARVSDRSFARSMKLRWLWHRMARHVTLFLAQSDLDAQRLIALGSCEPQVRNTGNLKYDVLAPKQGRIAELIRAAAGTRKILIGGSTVDGDPPEDSPLIWAQQSLPTAEKPLLVLAPRHPENFDIIFSMAIEFSTLRATEMLAGKTVSDGYSTRLRQGERSTAEIIVLDTIGDLSAVYGIADLAFVGGSLIKRGGHNPLEPAQFGVPVIMGPSFENFRDIVTRMKEVNAIRIAQDSNELEAAIVELLSNPEAARAMGERGRQVFEQQQGATKRTVEAILTLVKP